MVFQNPALYPHLSVFDNMAFGLRARGVARTRREGKSTSWPACSGSTASWPDVPALFPEGSGSEWRSAAPWRAQPRVILFDEPFSNLDVPLRASLREQVVDLHRRFGTTLIHVTHDQAEALLMGDRIVVLDRGQLLQCGTPRAVYDRPAHRFVATFVGSPPMNILPCQIEQRGRDDPGPPDRDRSRPPLDGHRVPTAGLGGNNPAVRPGIETGIDLGPRARRLARIAPVPGESDRAGSTGWSSMAPSCWRPWRWARTGWSRGCRQPRRSRIGRRVELLLDLSRAVWFDQTTGGAWCWVTGRGVRAPRYMTEVFGPPYRGSVTAGLRGDQREGIESLASPRDDNRLGNGLVHCACFFPLR